MNKLVVLLATATVALPAAPLAAQRRPLDGLGGYIQSAMAKLGGVGLAIAIVKDDSIVYARGFGVKKVGDPAPVTASTRFAIGSITKSFTATALAVLVDEGKLSWDDKVTDWLPGFQLYDPMVTREITVRDLLTHRSGLSRGDRLWIGTSRTRAELIRQLRYKEPAFGFRSRWSYQNLMFLAAGEIIPAVTGVSWDDFLTRRIFQPLGMSATSTTHRGLERAPNVATPHERRGGASVPIPFLDLDHVAPAGAIISNVLDMAQYMKLHLGGGQVGRARLLQPATAAELVTTQMAMRREGEPELTLFYQGAQFIGYGLGWILFDIAGTKAIEHSGGTDGMISELIMIPSARLGVVVLTNSSGLLAFPLAYAVTHRYLGLDDDPIAAFVPTADSMEQADKRAEEDLVRARVRNTRPSLPLERYAGKYSEPLHGEATVRIEGGHLVLRVAAFPNPVPLEHWHFDSFRGAWSLHMLGESLVTFRIGGGGRVVGMTIEGYEHEFAAERPDNEPSR